MSLPFQSLSPRTPTFNEVEYLAFLMDGGIDPPPSHPRISLFKQDMTPISFGSIFELESGEYTFVIKNTGESDLHIGTLTVDDGYGITQPEETVLIPNGQTTFTVTVT